MQFRIITEQNGTKSIEAVASERVKTEKDALTWAQEYLDSSDSVDGRELVAVEGDFAPEEVAPKTSKLKK